MSRERGSTARSSAARTAIPTRSWRERIGFLAWVIMALPSLADFQREQALRAQHQDAHHGEQREYLGHGAAQEELHGGLGLRDGERGSDGAEQAGGAAEHHHQEGV